MQRLIKRENLIQAHISETFQNTEPNPLFGSGALILGQDQVNLKTLFTQLISSKSLICQDSKGGLFDEAQSLCGNVTDVAIWEEALNQIGICDYYSAFFPKIDCGFLLTVWQGTDT